jgi:Zn-dependent peptidase ImmA (M78 family)
MGRRMTNNPPSANSSNSTIQTAVQGALSEKQYYINGLFDVFAFARSRSDITLKVLPLDDDVSGYIKIVNQNHFEIAINQKHTPLRQKFTLAHELGHYFLHGQKLNGQHTDIALFRDANEDGLGIEYAANDFAAELLMPQYDFRQAIKNGQNTPKKLSNYFQVTEKAVMYRAYKLGIIKSF